MSELSNLIPMSYDFNQLHFILISPPLNIQQKLNKIVHAY